LGKYYREYENSAKQNIAHYKASSINCGVTRNDQIFVDQSKKAKLQWLQDSSHTDVETGRMCQVKLANTTGTKEREYLKENINELQINSANNYACTQAHINLKS
jgi:hypothetical protein